MTDPTDTPSRSAQRDEFYNEYCLYGTMFTLCSTECALMGRPLPESELNYAHIGQSVAFGPALKFDA
jgi:hypothetical protein